MSLCTRERSAITQQSMRVRRVRPLSRLDLSTNYALNSNGITIHLLLHRACRRAPADGNLRPDHGASEIDCSFSSLLLHAG
jgi:hypothetical protein